MDADDEALLGHVVGPLLVDDLIGEGALCVVYRGRNQLQLATALSSSLEGMSQPVALTSEVYVLKFLRRRFVRYPHLIDLLWREGRIMQRLSHPAIASCYLAGWHHAHPYLLLSYAPGQTLRQYLVEHRLPSIPLAQALTIGTQLAEALAYLHSRGIAHRDIKPENIVLHPTGQVTLLDWGLAYDGQEGYDQVTKSLQPLMVGTLAYMAPEQVMGEEKGFYSQADVYSLGVCLYEMLTGVRPYYGRTPSEVARTQRLHSFMPLRMALPQLVQPMGRVIADLSAIIERALAHDPAHRYTAVADMRDALIHCSVRLKGFSLDEPSLDGLDGLDGNEEGEFDVSPSYDGAIAG